MTIKKRKKNSRQRGSHTHGWGSMKKHRGSGNKGGFGMAGTGKRADQKKPTILNEYGNSYYGKSGFNRPQKIIKTIRSINLDDLQSKLKKFITRKLITKDNEVYLIDAKKLGYEKILARGNLRVKMNIKAKTFSKLALKKIKDAGGTAEPENVLDK